MKTRRIILSLLALCLISAVVFGQFGNIGRDRYSGPIGPADIKYQNVLVVEPGNYKVADSLSGAYDWLKSSDQDGQMGALSQYNPRALILLPGHYDISGGLLLDTDDVHVYHSGSPEACVLNNSAAGVGASIEIHTYTVKQTADRVSLQGFTIQMTAASNNCSAFVTAATDNSDSKYRNMNFRRTSPISIKTPVFHQTVENGTWENCKADAYAWRVAHDISFNPTMFNCESAIGAVSDYSFGGDNNGTAGTGTIGGKFYNCRGGKYAFGGCTSFGMEITSAAEFHNCIADERSFGLGMDVAGKFYNCVGGRSCFGGYTYSTNSAYPPVFSGEAYNCKAGANSFGSGVRGTGTEPKFSGTLIGCVMEGDGTYGESMQCEGGRIENSRLQFNATDGHGLTLTDGNTKVYNTVIITDGTGKSLYAAAAQNVFAVHCRMNADKHANVTNLVIGGQLASAVALCIVDSDVN